jgi:hypothetical protein
MLTCKRHTAIQRSELGLSRVDPIARCRKFLLSSVYRLVCGFDRPIPTALRGVCVDVS